MKKLTVILLVLSLVFSMVSCTSNQKTEPKTTPQTQESTTETATTSKESSTDSGEFNWKGSGTVTVYSANGSDISEDMFAAFTAKTGVKVEAVYGGGGELLSRVDAEAANPLGDVVIGVTSDVLGAYTEYFQPYKIESVEPHIVGQDKLEESYWTEGAGGNIMIFLVNTDLLSEEDIPTKWADLIDEKYFGKIAFGDPTASSSAYIHMNIMQQLYGWEFVEKFYKNLDGKIIGSSSTIPKATADGEFVVALTIENLGADYVKAADNVRVIYPEDGTMRTAGGSVIIKNCKNPENAKLFVEFMFSKEVADILVKYNRRPSRVDVELAKGLSPFEKIKFMNYDYSKAADRENNLAKWNEIVTSN